MCRIKDFKFKNSANVMLRTGFMYKNGQIVILFDDGTVFSHSNGTMVVSHNGVILNKNNCDDFVATYIVPQNPIQQNINNGHSH